MGWWRAEIAALGLAGCALDSIVLDPELEQAELGSVCGGDGPFRVLPFGEHEGPINLYTGVTRFDERMYFVIGEHPREQGFPSRSRLVSTGPCGESERVIAYDIARVFEHPRWPGLLLGYTLANDVVVLDPAGVEPPAVLLRAVDFHDGWGEHGVVARAPPEPRRHDGETMQPPAAPGPGRLWLQPYPLDADAVPQPIVLLDPMPPEARWEARDDEVLVRARDRTLQRISLPDGERTTLLEDIEADFSLTADGHFVVVLRSATAVHIYDRETGIVAPVGVSTEPVRLSPNRVVLDLATAPPRTSRIVRLPSLERIDLPDHWSVLQPTGDTQWLVEHANGGFGLFDEDLGEVRALLEEPGELVTHREPDHDRFEAWVRAPSQRFEEGTLYEVDYEDGGVRMLASRSSAEHHHAPGGRIVTTTPSDDFEAMVLGLTDDEGNTRWEIDRSVLSWFTRFQDSAGYEDDVVIYAVSDGQRSGMWLARLPPPP